MQRTQRFQYLTWKIMKLTYYQLLLIATTICVAAANPIKGQDILRQKVSIQIYDQKVKNALQVLEKNAKARFVYSSKVIDSDRKISLNLTNKTLEEILEKLLTPLQLKYEVSGEQIVLDKAEKKENQQEAKPTTSVEMDRTITGKVTDTHGEPLAGVSIVLKESTLGAISDIDGQFSIVVPTKETQLVFSYIGFVTQERTIINETFLNIALEVDNKSLEEVVIVGYGTQKKANLTGSVSTVVIDDIQHRQVSNSMAALQGKVTGLRISQGTGMPGRERISVQLRGASSWGTNSSPLILVDGVVGSLDGLPVTDIESISVLKDAASSSIYGARAANGVILVTTKQGKKGKPTVSYNMTLRSETPTGKPKQIWNSAQYMELFNKAVARNAISAIPFDPSLIAKYKDPNRDQNLFPDYNWTDAVWKRAFVQDHNVGISGGSENFKYNMSAGVLDQDAVLIGHGYKRFTGLANLSANINKYITAGTNITYLNGKSQSPYYENQNFVLMTMTQAPMVKPYLPDGSGRYTDKALPTGSGGTQNNRNPLWIANETYRNYQDWQANIQGWADINFLHGKDMKLKLSNKYASRFTEQFQHIYHYGADAYYYLPEKEYVSGGSNEHIKGTPFGPEALAVFNNNYRTILNTYYSSLSWEYNRNQQDFLVMVGYSQEEQKYRWLTGNRNVFPVQNMHELDGMGALNQVVGGGLTEWSFRSVFARATYAYRSKYLLEGNFRYDGTSRIFKDSRWGFFPSASAAWRVSEENFIKEGAPWIENLKIRGSYGKLGNANIGDYPWQETYTTTSYAFNNSLEQGILQTAYRNRKLEWEKTAITNIGLDFNLRNDHLYGTLEWYNKYTTGILAGAIIPASSGMSAPTVNYGEFKNHGVELEVGHRNKIGQIEYDLNAQISINRNKVIKFPAPAFGNRIIEEGRPYNDYYLYEYIGIFKTEEQLKAVETPGNPQLGDLRFKDQNNDGKIDGNDRIPVKGAYPGYIYAFGANLKWKSFDLSLFFQGVEGQKVKTYFFGEDPFSQGSSPHPKFLDAYDPITNPDSDIPSIYGFGYAPMTGNVAQNSTYFLKNASYLRLKNIQLGYNIPATVLKKVGVQSLRLFLAGDNLLTFTKYPDLDPERAEDGWHAQYPQLKVVSVGLNLKF